MHIVSEAPKNSVKKICEELSLLHENHSFLSVDISSEALNYGSIKSVKLSRPENWVEVSYKGERGLPSGNIPMKGVPYYLPPRVLVLLPHWLYSRQDIQPTLCTHITHTTSIICFHSVYQYMHQHVG